MSGALARAYLAACLGLVSFLHSTSRWMSTHVYAGELRDHVSEAELSVWTDSLASRNILLQVLRSDEPDQHEQEQTSHVL